MCVCCVKMTSLQQEIENVKAGLRAINGLIAKGDAVLPDGLDKELESVGVMLSEVVALCNAKDSAKGGKKPKPIVAVKRGAQDTVGSRDEKIPEALRSIYKVSHELKKLSEIDPEGPQASAQKKVEAKKPQPSRQQQLQQQTQKKSKCSNKERKKRGKRKRRQKK